MAQFNCLAFQNSHRAHITCNDYTTEHSIRCDCTLNLMLGGGKNACEFSHSYRVADEWVANMRLIYSLAHTNLPSFGAHRPQLLLISLEYFCSLMMICKTMRSYAARMRFSLMEQTKNNTNTWTSAKASHHHIKYGYSLYIYCDVELKQLSHAMIVLLSHLWANVNISTCH